MLTVDVVSVMVNDQDKAQEFYTNVLGFELRHNIDLGGAAWLTVFSPAAPDGPEVFLEPDWNPEIELEGEPAAQVWKRTLYNAGIPATSFTSDDVRADFDRLSKKGVEFKMEPTEMGDVIVAQFDDTCGNLIQIQQMK